MAFSEGMRDLIKERAKYKSELSCRECDFLQCAHFFHDKNNPKYDSPEMGLLVTDIEHFIYHERFRKKPWRIGLKTHQNDETIQKAWDRILEQRVYNLEGIAEEINEAKESWDKYFEKIESFFDHPKSNQKVSTIIGA